MKGSELMLTSGASGAGGLRDLQTEQIPSRVSVMIKPSSLLSPFNSLRLQTESVFKARTHFPPDSSRREATLLQNHIILPPFSFQAAFCPSLFPLHLFIPQIFPQPFRFLFRLQQQLDQAGLRSSSFTSAFNCSHLV